MNTVYLRRFFLGLLFTNLFLLFLLFLLFFFLLFLFLSFGAISKGINGGRLAHLLHESGDAGYKALLLGRQVLFGNLTSI